ncbi:hypothetical protein U9M48_000630 [Paspalum notatum var. saurae]|uniref:Uncharacterized protein n=1 Tax=Paspalum notatum var. saurae TaxID=547442 RepID=A0AAQ3PH82_PASNO
MNQVMEMVLHHHNHQQPPAQSRYGVAEECRRAGPRPAGASPTAPMMASAAAAAKREAEEDTEEQEQQVQQELLRRGPWTVDEDLTLINYIAEHGEGRWNALARAAGLKRTGKSCRLRWLNYLRPDVKRGDFTADEQLLILDLHSRWGNRWSKIASQLPGRTDNEIKNYWRTRVQKHAKQLNCDVNSRRFKDAMRFLWMPRLAERASAAAAGTGTGTNHHAPTTAPPADSYHDDDYHCSPGATAASSSASTTTTSSSDTKHLQPHAATAGGDDDWAVAVAADHEFWSTASALQQLTAADHHRSSSSCCGGFQDDLITGWVQGFSEAGNIISSDASSLWSLDDIWRTMHC